MPFAGLAGDGTLRLNVPTGISRFALERDATQQVIGEKFDVPQPLPPGSAIPADTIVGRLCLQPADVLATRHAPIVALMSDSFVIARLRAR